MAETPPLPKWLRPLPVRALCVALPAAWAGFEFYSGQATWGLLFLAMAGWGFYTLILKPPPDPGN